ncbi:MAG: outer membrane protein assembly factor BamE [Burkholderiaceae bacterium]
MFQTNFGFALVWQRALCIIPAICLSACVSTLPSTVTTIKTTTEPTGVQRTENPRFLGILSPYRPDIQQGNFVSQEMMAQLKEGMTHDQVRFLMGTPLLNDLFHADRWDYVFRLQKGNGEVLSSRVTVFFKDDRVARFEGGNLPSEKDFLNLILGNSDKTK